MLPSGNDTGWGPAVGITISWKRHTPEDGREGEDDGEFLKVTVPEVKVGMPVPHFQQAAAGTATHCRVGFQELIAAGDAYLPGWGANGRKGHKTRAPRRSGMATRVVQGMPRAV